MAHVDASLLLILRFTQDDTSRGVCHGNAMSGHGFDGNLTPGGIAINLLDCDEIRLNIVS